MNNNQSYFIIYYLFITTSYVNDKGINREKINKLVW